MAVVGVDACKSGWIAVALRDGMDAQAHHLGEIGELPVVVPDAAAVAVDIPIGLPERSHRRADLEARAVLGPRRTSLFLTPVRAALEAPTHAQATAISRRISGSGVSQQAYRLATKIFEVERWLPIARCGVWEVHPELSFAELMGQPARASKKTWAGMVERRAALAAVGIDVDDVAATAGSRAAVDDMLDAAVVAWTATRLLDGTARPVPDPPETDRAGRGIAIWV